MARGRLGQNVDWDKQPKSPRPRAVAVMASAHPPHEERFATKLTRAVKALASARSDSCKQAEERAERERSRYPGRGGLRRRERTKCE